MYQKWWFWVCVVVPALIIGFTSIILIKFNILNPDKNLSKLAKELQAYHNDVIVFQSVGKNNIVIECNFNDIETEQEKEYKLGEIVGENIYNLSTYKNIQLNLNIEGGQKTILNINPQTQEVDKTIQTWILDGSEAQTKVQNKIEELEQNKTQLESVIEELETNKQDLEKEIATLTETKTKSTSAQDVVLTAGKYVVGEDINVGKYDIIAQSGQGNIYIPQKVNEVMGTTNDKYYLKNYNNVTLKNGDTIEISGQLKVKFQAK